MSPGALLIAGPTAAGKSALAVQLALALGGEIINADSMQVYSGLKILSARPSEDDLAAVPHHLYGVLSPGQVCSVQSWLDMAGEAIAGIRARDRVPILVGGTGLYFRAALEGLSPVPEIPDEIRGRVRELADQEGTGALAQALAERDPVMAERLPPGDRQRQARALEVKLATGRSLAEWQGESGPGLFDDGPQNIVKFVVSLARQALYSRIDTRFEVMVGAGAVNEVRALLADGFGAGPALKALGVPQLRAHLAGEMSLEEAVVKAQTESRRYAKRQLTWFRNQCADWVWLDVDSGDLAAQAMAHFDKN